MMKVFQCSGSKCVVQIGPNWERYIDARIDTRLPDYSCIEVVVRGHVVKHKIVHDSEAPETIIAWAKELM